MTISLEHIVPEDWRAVERMRVALQSLVIDAGGQSLGLRIGTGSATWTAAVNSASVTVPHGLGKTPTIAGAFTRDLGIAYAVTARDATNITVRGFATAGTPTSGTATFDWAVIG